ncbi:chalcone isomerase family protein [Natronospira bacteriovora]|uniref:Chalcone isomerase family protein n=1 Tax=Natronospira bacteriovora TaxID=3069753 RepID=A0ABU0W6T1_9GAMM|nr:chalcone isomerase family protein [Natronospira sp. AB-CW4]MDQ2069662.1 chalcone isomerase family protein [Natronospira sp. AB-CW4]
MKNFSLLGLLAALTFSASVMAQEAVPATEADREVMVEGIGIPAHVTVGGTELGLNGTGIRRAFFRNFYVGALYLTEPMSSLSEIVSRNETNRIALHFIRDVSISRMRGALDDGFENNTPAEEREAFSGEIEAFKSFFEPPTQGDRIDIDFDPERGTIVTINGEEKGVIENTDFHVAVLRIFLGENPADNNLRDGMLGVD